MASSAARALREAVRANLGRVRERLAHACAKAGRPHGTVAVVLVTKYGGPSLVESLVEEGALDLGENRAERILALDAALGRGAGIRWHMIGHLQRNKARKLAGVAACLHSLDSLELAEKLDARRRELALPPLPTYLEVNTGGEEQKSGVAPSELEALAAGMAPFTALRVDGLMTIPPETSHAEGARPFFAKLRGLLPVLEKGLGRKATGLSMGMTDDFEVAVAEGATVVRIGRALLEGIPEDVLRQDRESL
jgi:pyridoxal phosphate enzyme (YggS family)